MLIYYQSEDTSCPQLICAESEAYPGEVAVSASFVPTFQEPPAPEADTEVREDEEFNQSEVSSGKDFHFIFIIDRSGSMTINNRIHTAKQALGLFMRSLPLGSRFSVCSFGDFRDHRPPYKFMELGGRNVIEYNNNNAKAAIT